MYQVQLRDGRILKLNASQVRKMRKQISSFVLPASGLDGVRPGIRTFSQVHGA